MLVCHSVRIKSFKKSSDTAWAVDRRALPSSMSGNSPPLKDPENVLSCCQEPATEPYP
jgi:hypothetical protein